MRGLAPSLHWPDPLRCSASSTVPTQRETTTVQVPAGAVSRTVVELLRRSRFFGREAR